mmetsp:Transcript_25428/g.64629  ORF Transcript_25428/g.64629 Transcript_25428/m.64629 type:complete len:227 (+) Transcript_25428:41-721(+)
MMTTIAAALHASSLGFVPAATFCNTPLMRVSPSVVCMVDGEDPIKIAANRVVRAAEQFGSTQGAAAADWVKAVTRAKGADFDANSLLEQQLQLFEECIIDEDGDGNCQELDTALSDLETLMASGALKGAQLERAVTRVRMSAAKFGPEQERVAIAWADAVRDGSCSNPAALLESQSALFDECLVDEDGGPERCIELEESLAALQLALGVGGRVVSTAGMFGAEVRD